MKEIAKRAGEQALSILLAAAAAAGIAFIQALAAKSGACPNVVANPETASILGATLKGSHSIWNHYRV